MADTPTAAPAMATARDDRLPVHVVTGFLGAGKTTLLRRALRDERMADTLVLVNEVAELGVDDRLLRVDGMDVALLANGCLCCAASEGLGDALRRIVESPAARSIARVVIETTGLADPLPVLSTIAVQPFLAARLRVELVVTVVDALHATVPADGLDYGRQIQAADVVLLSKTDLATPGQVEAARQVVHAHNPVCAMHESRAVELAAIVAGADGGVAVHQRADRIATGLFAAVAGSAEAGASRSSSPAPAERTRLRIGHRFAATGPHAGGVQAFCIELGEDLDWTRLAVWLSALLHRHGDDVLRVKGFLALEGLAPPVVFNAVRHVIHFPEHLAEWPDGDRRSFLVFIVRRLVPDQVLRSFMACVRRPRLAASAAAATVTSSTT